MKKDASVKLGETKCDFCNGLATHIMGALVSCDECAILVKASSDKAVPVQIPLKSAGIILRDLHE